MVWVLGAEITDLETRTSGMSAVVFCNYMASFIIGTYDSLSHCAPALSRC